MKISIPTCLLLFGILFISCSKDCEEELFNTFFRGSSECSIHENQMMLFFISRNEAGTDTFARLPDSDLALKGSFTEDCTIFTIQRQEIILFTDTVEAEGEFRIEDNIVRGTISFIT